MISTIGSFVLAAGVLVTVYNVVRSIRKGRRPDPIRGWRTRSSGSRRRRRPQHNFDVIPTVRSLEPMKDIRRSVQEREAALAAGAGQRRRQPAVASSRNRSVTAVTEADRGGFATWPI